MSVVTLQPVLIQNVLFLFQIFRHSFLAKYEIIDLETR
jgi:hypothetical protein